MKKDHGWVSLPRMQTKNSLESTVFNSQSFIHNNCDEPSCVVGFVSAGDRKQTLVHY